MTLSPFVSMEGAVFAASAPARLPSSLVTVADKPKRSWLRFSLRSLFLLTVAIAVLLGWTIYKVRQEGIAVTALRKFGCSVDYDYRDPTSGAPPILEQLRKLLGEDESRSVTRVDGSNIDGKLTSHITDAGLVHLQGWPHVHDVRLAGTHITDVGLVHLEGLSQFITLVLTNTRVTGDGLVHLQGLRKLGVLYLDGTQVMDAGLAHLQGLRTLEVNSPGTPRSAAVSMEAILLSEG